MDALTYIYLSLVLLTLLLYSMNLKSNQPHGIYIIIYMGVILLTSAIALSATEFFMIKNNLFVFHVYTPLEYSVLALLYYKVFEGVVIKKIIQISIPAFIVLCVFFSTFIQTLSNNNSVTTVLESIIIVVLSLLFIRETMILQRVNTLQRFPMFWISLGLLFYFIGNLLIEGLLNYMIKESMELAKKAYRLGFIFRYILVILLMIGAYCKVIFKKDSIY